QDPDADGPPPGPPPDSARIAIRIRMVLCGRASMAGFVSPAERRAGHRRHGGAPRAAPGRGGGPGRPPPDPGAPTPSARSPCAARLKRVTYRSEAFQLPKHDRSPRDRGDDAPLAEAGPCRRPAERLDLRRDPLADARDDRGGGVQRAGALREPVDGRTARAERAVRPPVVHVQPDLPAGRGVRAEPRRARARGRVLRADERAGAGVDRPDRHRALRHPLLGRGAGHGVAGGAELVGDPRDVVGPGRPCPLPDQDRDPGVLRPAAAPGHRGRDREARADPAGRGGRGEHDAGGPGGGAARARGGRVMEGLWGPAMFVSALVLIFSGFPVAFALAGTALIFAALGSLAGQFDWVLLRALPDRIFGTMSNYTLLAVPFFIFMGAILEKSRLAERLL